MIQIPLLLLGVLLLFGLGLWAYHVAPRGPLPIRKREPIDDAFVHRVVRFPSGKHYAAGFSDDRRAS